VQACCPWGRQGRDAPHGRDGQLAVQAQAQPGGEHAVDADEQRREQQAQPANVHGAALAGVWSWRIAPGSRAIAGSHPEPAARRRSLQQRGGGARGVPAAVRAAVAAQCSAGVGEKLGQVAPPGVPASS
jgi:hypothetical protein